MAPGIEHEKAAFDALPDGVLIADEAGTVVLVNLAGSALLRRSIDETLGRDYREVLPLTDVGGPRLVGLHPTVRRPRDSHRPARASPDAA